MMAHSHEHAPGVDCTSAARELWDYLDQELTPDRMEALHSHFTRCKPCLKNVEWGRQFLDALKSCSEKERQAPGELRDRIAMLLRTEGFAGPS